MDDTHQLHRHHHHHHRHHHRPAPPPPQGFGVDATPAAPAAPGAPAAAPAKKESLLKRFFHAIGFHGEDDNPTPDVQERARGQHASMGLAGLPAAWDDDMGGMPSDLGCGLPRQGQLKK